MLDNKLEYIKQTITMHFEEVCESKEATNDLVVIDFLKAIGYDYRRDQSVKRKYGDLVDWLVYDSENKPTIALVVDKYKSEYSEEEMKRIISAQDKYHARLTILFNGEDLRIFIPELNTSQYCIETNIWNGENREIIVEYLSKETFNSEGLVDIYIGTVREALYSGVEKLLSDSETVDKLLDYSSIDKTNTVKSEAIGIVSEICKNIAGSNSSDEVDVNYDDSEDIHELEEAINTLKAKNAELLNDAKSMKEKLDEAQKLNGNLTSEIELLKSSNIELKNQIEHMQNEDASTENKVDNTVVDELTAELNSAKAQNSELLASNENLSTEIFNLNNTISEKGTIIANLTSDIEVKNTQISELSTKVEELNSQLNDVKSVKINASALNKDSEHETDNNSDIIRNYRQQIQQLSVEVSKKDDKIAELEAKIDELSHTKSIKDTEEYAEAQQLLDSIEEDEESTKNYVGIVNKKMFQTSNLTEFISRCISELYELVNYELMPLLFDGDMFKITESKETTPLLLNNHFYDIDVSGNSDDEILNKIRGLYSRFPDIIFLCKYVGTVVKLEEDAKIDFGDTNEDLNTNKNFMLALSISDLRQYLNQSDSNIRNMRYISCNSYPGLIFNIHGENLNESINKAASALLAYSNSDDFSKTLGVQSVSQGSFYYDIDTLLNDVITLSNICTRLNINESDIFIYFEAEYKVESVFAQCFIDTSEMVAQTTKLVTEKDDNIAGCIVAYSYIESLMDHVDGHKIEDMVISDCMAIKTPDLEARISTPDKNEQIFQNIVETGNTGLSLDSILDELGNIIGTPYRVMSYDSSEVREPFKMNISNQEVFISKLSPAELTRALLKLYGITHSDRKIGIRISVNKTIIDKLTSPEYVTQNPCDYMVGKVLTEYISKRIK